MSINHCVNYRLLMFSFLSVLVCDPHDEGTVLAGMVVL